MTPAQRRAHRYEMARRECGPARPAQGKFPYRHGTIADVEGPDPENEAKLRERTIRKERARWNG